MTVRKRVEKHPPRFEAETEHARAWLEIHAGLWSPKLRDVKRLEDGRSALLFRDRCGTALAAVLDRRGQVRDVVTRDEFRDLVPVSYSSSALPSIWITAGETSDFG